MFTYDMETAIWAAFGAGVDRIMARGVRNICRGALPSITMGRSGMQASILPSLWHQSGSPRMTFLSTCLMALNFQSWLDPFIILMALPGALAGILWILVFMTQTTFSVPSLMGSIMCIELARSQQYSAGGLRQRPASGRAWIAALHLCRRARRVFAPSS